MKKRLFLLLVCSPVYLLSQVNSIGLNATFTSVANSTYDIGNRGLYDFYSRPQAGISVSYARSIKKIMLSIRYDTHRYRAVSGLYGSVFSYGEPYEIGVITETDASKWSLEVGYTFGGKRLSVVPYTGAFISYLAVNPYGHTVRQTQIINNPNDAVPSIVSYFVDSAALRSLGYGLKFGAHASYDIWRFLMATLALEYNVGLRPVDANYIIYSIDFPNGAKGQGDYITVSNYNNVQLRVGLAYKF